MRKFSFLAIAAMMLATAVIARAGDAPLMTDQSPRVMNARSAGHRGPVRGNVVSRIYEWPGCPDYKRIRPERRVEFPSGAAAEAAGYRAAMNCHYFR
ncbi:MAG: hypothetical protein IVW56_04560 [Candidatus Binataceae bacterium]|nr:hypothetical protein [Candidatus Binataceae bacterium]